MLAQIDRHTEAFDELDVQGILAFEERILPRASDLWVQAPLDYKQRLRQLFFPEGVAYDGNRFNRAAATAPLFNYLAPSGSADNEMVSRRGIGPATDLRTWCTSPPGHRRAVTGDVVRRSCPGDTRHGGGDDGTSPRLSGRSEFRAAPQRRLSTESSRLWWARAGDDGSLGLMLVLCFAQCGRFLE